MLARITAGVSKRCGGYLKAVVPTVKRYTMSARSERRLLDDQDEMEYNITFPTPSGMEDPDVKEPVVYVLGWAGSTDRLLAKYSSIYEREGCITLRYTLPTDKMFIITPTTVQDIQELSKKLLGLLDDYDLRENPVMFHVFSNAGAILYRWTAELFLEENVNIIGVVMDSCPSRLTYSVGLKAIYFIKRPLGHFACLSYIAQFFFSSIKAMATFSWDPRFDVYEALKTSDKNLWPHLLLYSTNDGVIPPESVREVAEGRKSAGAVLVKSYDFTSSPHVFHLKIHKEKYVEECVQFLDNCLKIYDGEDPDPDREQNKSYSDCEPSTSSHKSLLWRKKPSQIESRV